jgi:cysteine desulfurase
VIYLDHHATTPLDPRVRDAMEPYFSTAFGNPHSRDHAVGWRASEAVETARGEIAAAIGADTSEIIFTSGATEANNLALRGIGGPVVSATIEHPSVLNTADITKVPVGRDGLVDPATIAGAIRPDTRLVSIALVNHEIGVIQPIAEIARLAHEKGVLVHADCAQALGKTTLDMNALGVDLASFSAHKAHGPMGIGALFIRRGAALTPLITGGGQEMGLRAGTVPLPLAVGFGTAARIARAATESDRARIGALRDRLLQRLSVGIPDLVVNGSMSRRAAGNLNLSLPAVDAETLLLELPDIAISTGSACASGSDMPSPVLAALGLGPERAARSLRICLGRFTTEDEIEGAGEAIISAWRRLSESQSSA